MRSDRSATRHELKTIQPFYDAIESGHKTFELRIHDRDFRVGDQLWLREWNGIRKVFGKSMHRRVTYIMASDGEVLPPEITGLMDGYCILGLGPS